MKNKIKLSFGFLMILLILPFVNAFGVTSPYWSDNPLIMYSGQTKDFSLILQNMVSTEDITLKAELIEGKEIATLTDSNLDYLVPVGRKDIPVNIRITIPEDNAAADYTVGISFKQISENEGKMVQMTSSVEKYIPIIIKSKTEVQGEAPRESPVKEKISLINIIILLVIALGIIICYTLFTKRKTSNEKNK